MAEWIPGERLGEKALRARERAAVLPEMRQAGETPTMWLPQEHRAWTVPASERLALGGLLPAACSPPRTDCRWEPTDRPIHGPPIRNRQARESRSALGTPDKRHSFRRFVTE